MQKLGALYQPSINWLFGCGLDIWKPDGADEGAVNLKVVFIDPKLYGAHLVIQSPGKSPVVFLDVQVLYTQISAHLGRYAITIAPPTALKHIQAGPLNLQLPDLGIDIYTNGDWKLDFGFPKSMDDWSASAQMTLDFVPPLTGGGGFYCAKRSSATEDIFVNDYATIIEAGVACQLGFGLAASFGPVNIDASLTYQAKLLT